MQGWPNDRDVMGPTVTRAESAKVSTPPLKNGNDMRESGYLIAVGSRTARFRRKHKNKMFFVVMLTIFLILLSVVIAMSILYAKLIRHKINVCESKECLRSAANLAISMDTSADPCDDFYQYVCGNWAEDHPRPDAYHSYDWFRDKQSKVYTAVRDFLTRNTTLQPKPVHQAKDMYTACMDTETLDKRGLKPVIEVLKAIGLPSYPTYLNLTEDFDYSTYSFDWLETVINIKTYLGMDVLIGFDIFTDPKNSSMFRLVMGSPETTNPFPSLRNERKKHAGRKSIEYHLSKKIDKTGQYIFNNEHNFEGSETKSDEEDKSEIIYKVFYAELMKLFVIEAGDMKDTTLTETDMDQKFLIAASDYLKVNDDIYELESDNETTSTEDDFFHPIPEYTVTELQAQTDIIVENNNGTPIPIWKRYLEGIFNISKVELNFETDKILVSELDLKYMGLMAAMVEKTPPVVVELYIWIKVVEVMAVHTTTELRMLFQRSYEEVRSHRSTSSPPKSLQCASAVNDMLGMAIAYAIADPYFLNVTKPKIHTMLHEMKNALAHLVGQTKWMDDDTKLATYQKIIQMKTLIGFPDWLLEEGSLEQYYEGIEIDTEKHLENMINIVQVKVKNALNKFREGNNFTWATDPTEVNAYHTFQENTIRSKVLQTNILQTLAFLLDAAVPLVMLQHPFFDLGLDSLNYGSLGTVLGHEITHGFDNFGRQFDKNGNLLPWWSNNTIDSFINMTQCFVDQYSTYYLPELGEHVDGQKTLGENIADNGGLREALAALKHHLRKYGPEKKLPGFEHMSSEQLFFLSYGNLWCGVSTKDSLRADLDDEHSPQQFRARGALQNSEHFVQAWNCPKGSNMNPEKRCIIF